MVPLLLNQVLSVLLQLSRSVPFLNISMRRMRLKSVSRSVLWHETATMRSVKVRQLRNSRT